MTSGTTRNKLDTDSIGSRAPRVPPAAVPAVSCLAPVERAPSISHLSDPLPHSSSVDAAINPTNREGRRRPDFFAFASAAISSRGINQDWLYPTEMIAALLYIVANMPAGSVVCNTCAGTDNNWVRRPR